MYFVYLFSQVLVQDIFAILTNAFCSQSISSGWFTSYSFRCQPVDYSRSPNAMRVSTKHACDLRVPYLQRKNKTLLGLLRCPSVTMGIKTCMKSFPLTLNFERQEARYSTDTKITKNRCSFINITKVNNILRLQT